MALTSNALRTFSKLALNQSIRMFARSALAEKNHYKVLIAGGGTGGCAVAGRLGNMLDPVSLAVIEPHEVSNHLLDNLKYKPEDSLIIPHFVVVSLLPRGLDTRRQRAL